MRVVESAIWTSGEPVSFSARRYSAITLLLTSVSSAKPNRNYTCQTLRHVFDAAVGAGIRSRPPRTWSIDDDCVGMAQGVVSGGHQLDLPARAAEIARVGVVGLDLKPLAAGLDAPLGPGPPPRGFEPKVHQVDQDL